MSYLINPYLFKNANDFNFQTRVFKFGNLWKLETDVKFQLSSSKIMGDRPKNTGRIVRYRLDFLKPVCDI